MEISVYENRMAMIAHLVTKKRNLSGIGFRGAAKNIPGLRKTPRLKNVLLPKKNIHKYLEEIKVKKGWVKKKKGDGKLDFAMLGAVEKPWFCGSTGSPRTGKPIISRYPPVILSLSKDQQELFQQPLLPQIYNLINEKDRKGRARLCVEHMRMQAEGKTMKDADVDWQSMRKRNAPNPRREQHDARVLKRIERIIFNRGNKGDEAWRHGPVDFITLEVPQLHPLMELHIAPCRQNVY